MSTRKALFIACCIFIALVGAVATFVLLNGPKRQSVESPRTTGADVTSDGSVIQYAEYSGHPVELWNDHGRLCLRMRFENNHEDGLYDDATLNFLKSEVERLTDGQYNRLGQTNYMFLFTKGWPYWAPSVSHLLDASYHNLYFGDLENSIFPAALIMAHGDKSHPEYYPYHLVHM